MFKCKVCVEKEKRILELKDQVAYLRSLSIPFNDPVVNYSNPWEDTEPVTAAERSPDPQMQEIRESLDEDAKEAATQRDAMLAGTY